MKFLFKIFALFVLIGIQLPLAAASQPSQVEVYLAYGQASLLTKDADSAVAYLDQASSLIDPADKEALFYQFLLSFEQVIAFDQLGNRAACQQAIGALTLLQYGDKESDYEMNCSDEIAQLVMDVLRAMIATAPSADVKALLTDQVNEIADFYIFFSHLGQW